MTSPQKPDDYSNQDNSVLISAQRKKPKKGSHAKNNSSYFSSTKRLHEYSLKSPMQIRDNGQKILVTEKRNYESRKKKQKIKSSIQVTDQTNIVSDTVTTSNLSTPMSIIPAANQL